MIPGVWEKQGASTFNPWSGLKNVEQQLGATAPGRQYDAFGNILAQDPGWTGSPSGYGGAFGYQEDGDSGLKLLGHRYYDPDLGRFLSRDPIKDGRNWYVYCENNPLTWVDPSGLMPSISLPPEVIDNWPTPPPMGYPSSDAAAKAAAREGHPKTQQTGNEFGGWIFRYPDGSWGYTIVEGTPVSVVLGPQPENASGIWHTHPPGGLPYPGKPGYVTADSNFPSPADHKIHKNTYGPDYLVGYGGVVWKIPKEWSPGGQFPIGRV